MSRGNRATRRRRLFSVGVSVIVIFSSMFVGIFIQVSRAGLVNHTTGNLHINSLTDFGRILGYVEWNGTRHTVTDPATGNAIGFIGLVLDHDGYDHTVGAEQVADCYGSWPYAGEDDLTVVDSIDFVVDNSTLQKSIATFENTGASTGDPYDVLVNQTAWTLVNENWAIIQWAVYNQKNVTLTNFCLGLEVALSVTGGGYGVGGDSGDDIDGYDAVEDIYWAQDDSGPAIGFASAFPSDPINHYHSTDYYNNYTFNEYKNKFANDTWLYNRLHTSNAVVGATPGNRTTTIGWNGVTINPGSVHTFTLVIAVDSSLGDIQTAVQDARNYYSSIASRFFITEFNDADSGTQQIEVYSHGKEPADMGGAGYFFSVDGGTTALTGTWDKNPLPTYEYGIFTLIWGDIGPEGDTIGLYQDMGGGNYELIDQVAYGQEGTAPDPLTDESVARHYDSAAMEYTDDWFRNASSGTTWGAQNDVGIVIPSPSVVLNSVMFNPMDPNEGYVEIYNKGPSSIDISDYTIVCDDAFIIPKGTTLDTTNRFFVLTHTMAPIFFAYMDPFGDNVYLYHSNDNRLDMAGWSSAHTQGKFMARVPDGNGTFGGFDDSSSIAAGWVFDMSPGLIITEISADDAMTAQIEVYNPGGGDIVPSPAEWWIDSELGTMTGTWSADPIHSGGYSVFTRTGGAQVAPEGDTFTLHHDGSVVVDTVSFGTMGPAPDPLVSESVGRWWNSTANEYSHDWNRNASTGPTWGAQNDVPAVITGPGVILQEVMFYPAQNPDGKFIILYNIGNSEVDISNWSIIIDDIFEFSTVGFPIKLPGRSFFIMRYSDETAWQPVFDGMDASGDNVYMYNQLGERIDMAGWNTPHTQGMSVKRVPDGNGTYDGYDDTSSEAAGWVFNSPLEVFLTEISDDGGTSQIEVYNFWYPPIDFSVGGAGYSFANRTGAMTGTWTDPVAGPGEYAVFDVDPGFLYHDGDIIKFTQNGILIEKIGYGLYGAVPDPLDFESVQRYRNGTEYTEYWERNWSSGPNFGFHNDVPEPYLNSTAMLNEVMFNPNVPGDYFVEIYYNGTTSMNLSGWRILGDIEYLIPTGIILNTSSRLFYLLYAMAPLFFYTYIDRNGDNIYLYTDNGSLVDMVGWSTPHVQGESMFRFPDGNGTRDGYDDPSSMAAGWFFNVTTPPPSPPAPPRDLSAKLVSGGADVMLHWNASMDDGMGDDDTAGYTVYKSTTDFNGSYDFEAWVPANGSSSYFWIDVGAGDGDWNNYYYRVRTNDTSGKEERNTDTAGKFVNYLLKEWNLISMPLMQLNSTMEHVFQTIMDNLIVVQTYHAGKSRPWLHWVKPKPHFFNDKIPMDHKGGYYVIVENPDYLVVAGRVPSSTEISMKTGWNLVGYPCPVNKTVADALSSISGKYNIVDTYDPVTDKVIRLNPDDFMEPGLGYWIHTKEDCVLVI